MPALHNTPGFQGQRRSANGMSITEFWPWLLGFAAAYVVFYLSYFQWQWHGVAASGLALLSYTLVRLLYALIGMAVTAARRQKTCP